ncbi:Na+/H+ antiporter NhaA [Nocardioides marmoriginsengisoli]|uniref:Na(+)/H(+) antiporter NhaA n=1 Tax=Nocardioides marmoriginsengisoli TaxID=661483 RepID=A0A3N0CFE7_9ACTN|nr:Na+/H+ antiporter NhaA [Nocardioides marmoriginsengisoli]RNL62180.1 Na+/H+ antiporter NhaA [Nocardioides marmoriginsengisoli]
MTTESDESTFVGSLIRSETVGGIVALVAAAVAVLWVNLDPGGYDALRTFEIGPLDLQHWAADGALAVFFFVAGLELKREFLLGSLRRPADAAVPVVAAICGVALPALIYVLVNVLSSSGSDNLGGWAIPAATDIAFALAVLAVVGSALPPSLRAFLLTLAVVDDLIVIIIIAVFYTETIDLGSLLGALAVFAAYGICQRLRIRSVVVYLPLALGGWWLLHESGVHATIAGVVLGLLTRVLPDTGEQRSPAERLEHLLSPVSAGIAVPFFALMSAGVALSGAGDLVSNPLVIGVVLGLLVGKPVGILFGSWAVTRFTRAELDDSLGWRDVAGVAVLGGVGFTVSLLVSDLSFSGSAAEEAKTAVLIGSVAAALLGAALLGRRNRHHRQS